jgi:hypothetical protein
LLWADGGVSRLPIRTVQESSGSALKRRRTIRSGERTLGHEDGAARAR